ncbi:MAG: hypothetical protein U0164_23960 [Gemmatimonadaceae bacterium]
MFITENQLDEWVRGNAQQAQGVIVELVARLVAASSPGPTERRFPLGDSIGQPGPDGVLDTEFAYEPFVPLGRSYWEIGTGIDANKKATSDYSGLLTALPASEREEATFLFVTPLSGRRGWKSSGKNGQEAWCASRRHQVQWKDVRVLDGTKLIEWLHDFPAVAMWLADKLLGLRESQAEALEQIWNLNRSIGEPPPLCPDVFLVNREDARSKLGEVLAGTSTQLKLQTRFPAQVADFVAAHVAAMDEPNRLETFGRCIVVRDDHAWNTLVSLRAPHVLIADSSLDLAGELGTRLIQKARRGRHSVVFGSLPGGLPDPSAADLPSPKAQKLKEALEGAGYLEERARVLATKSDGNLGSLLRCLQNLSLMPEWSQGTPASELVIAQLLGEWDEQSEGDRAAAESLAGNAYGEWIGDIRALAAQPGTPLAHRETTWRALLRYEAWYALGPRVFDDHLERLRSTAVEVLGERHPKLTLPSSERFAAAIHGRTRKFSPHLRQGIATTIALLGSHARALKSCTSGRPESTALLIVRDLLRDADWERWASLNDVLPLLAEASPSAFLDAVEMALETSPCPFDDVFAQEGDGFLDGNYITGLLWALETLAWDEAYVGRTALVLAGLASRDPGGKYANRPINSLRTIFLPWLPQTCASTEMRASAVKSLLHEYPDVGWDLLIGLLPETGSVSMGSRKPEWRETIPEDWSRGVTREEYRIQVEGYASMALSAARADPVRLVLLVESAEKLPPAALAALADHLSSSDVVSMPEERRLPVWAALADLVAKHRKFATAAWAMAPQYVDRLDAIAKTLAPNQPTLVHRRLFSERDVELFDELGDYEAQAKVLDERRDAAVQQIAQSVGTQGVIEFAVHVEAPWRVGIAFASSPSASTDSELLPDMLMSDRASDERVLSGYVWRRFRLNGWPWVDELGIEKWPAVQVGRFLSLLPFVPDAWKRADMLLGADAKLYWTSTSANPYDTEDGLALAAERLVVHGRPLAAIRCLEKLRHDKKEFDPSLAIRALLAGPGPSEQLQSMDSYHLLEIIKWLQNADDVDVEALLSIEWSYLPLLQDHRGGSPRTLSARLSTDPNFFCEVVRLCFRGKHAQAEEEQLSESQKGKATNAYRLLREWNVPPGTNKGEPYDGDALRDWLSTVRTECTATGHVEVAMSMIGHVLVHAPQDPDGLWIHRAVAGVLNGRDASEMRDGFRTELFNSRGVHWVDPTGAPELALASNYRTKAKALDSAGFSRLAATLRELADSYGVEAERIRSRHGDDD